jgi:hypothetical protein
MIDSGEIDDVGRISISRQGQEVLAFAQRFAALLKTYPSPVAAATGPNSVWALVRRIGEHFYRQVVEKPFDSEPHLSFIVDAQTDEAILTLVQVAVNLGAIVYVPDGQGEVIMRSVRGKRFRLSYWLAPLLKLPPVLGNAVALSTILRSASAPINLDLPFGVE